MFLFPCPFMNTVHQGLAYLLELTIPKIQEKFFEGATRLDPGMPPGIHTIETLLIAGIFDDMLRMT